MLDVRIPDDVIATIPDKAFANRYHTKEDADALKAKCELLQPQLIQARNNMVEGNLHLLDYFLTKKNQPANHDKINDGAIGLMAVVDRWDRFSRYRFSTYAGYYIKGYALNAQDESSSTIRIPSQIHKQLNKLRRVEKEVCDLNGEIPNADTMARLADLPVARVRYLRTIVRDDRPLKYQQMHDLGIRRDIDLDSFPSPEGNPHPNAAQSEISEAISTVLRTLTPREERVVKMRFGLEDGAENTLDEVAESFQVDRKRMRQIEAKSLRKLRHPSRSKKLKHFI